MKYLLVLIILFIGLAIVTDAQIASGGQFTLNQSVIATGGGASTAGNYTIAATSGQAVAGIRSTGSPFKVDGGFWTAQPLTATAATVALGGRVTTADGRGIRNVFVTLTQADGTTRTVLTSTFGYFQFDEVFAGETVIISLRSRHFNFAQPTQVLTVNNDVTDLNFVALEQN
jgi:Carboxypeptidase regulatory-like domain